MAKAIFLGVYSTRGIPGLAGRNAGTQRKHYWFIWHDPLVKTYLAQQLNTSYDPVGEPGVLASDLFRVFTREPRVTILSDLQPETTDYLNNAFASSKPEKSPGDITIVSGRVKDVGEHAPVMPFMADVPFSISEPAKETVVFPEDLDKTLRAEFAMGIMRFRRGNRDGAVAEFRRLVAVTDGIMAAHKHMFTDFGRDLRKCKLFELAATCFLRVLELSPKDSHAYFNLARTYYEMGKFSEACDYLAKTLELEPDLKCARKLLEKTRIQMEAFIPEEF